MLFNLRKTLICVILSKLISIYSSICMSISHSINILPKLILKHLQFDIVIWLTNLIKIHRTFIEVTDRIVVSIFFEFICIPTINLTFLIHPTGYQYSSTRLTIRVTSTNTNETLRSINPIEEVSSYTHRPIFFILLNFLKKHISFRY